MAPTNVFFSPAIHTEQNLYEDLVIEGLRMYGQDVYYMPRDVVRDDDILNENFSEFRHAHTVEMYIANTQGFEGEGTLLSKFGLEIRDQATFVVAKRRFQQLVEIEQNTLYEERPREGDLIYLPLSNSLFQIKFVEHEQPFYRLSDLPVYELQCELYEYASEDIDTGIGGIDIFEARNAARVGLLIEGGSEGIEVGTKLSQALGPTDDPTAQIIATVDNITEKVTGADIVNSGYGYVHPPELTFPEPIGNDPASATAVIDSEGKVVDVTFDHYGSRYDGDFFIDVEESPAPVSPVFVTGDVAYFEYKSDSQAEVFLSNVITKRGDSSFVVGGQDLYNETDQIQTGWSILDVYSLEDERTYLTEDDYADNSNFEVDGDQIIDFSEINPFGEPS